MTTIGIGLLGLGTVGSQVAEHLVLRRDRIAERTGAAVELRHILVRSLDKPRDYLPDRALLTTQADTVLDDPAVGVVIELMGGMEPARTYIERAIESGKAVVTANKEVMA